jgi:hypothetical protein
LIRSRFVKIVGDDGRTIEEVGHWGKCYTSSRARSAIKSATGFCPLARRWRPRPRSDLTDCWREGRGLARSSPEGSRDQSNRAPGRIPACVVSAAGKDT